MYLARLQRLTERLEKIVPKPMKTPTVSTPIAQWMCECRLQILRAREAVHVIRAGGKESDEQWEALVATMAGVLPNSVGKTMVVASTNGRNKGRRMVDRV